MKKMIVAFAAGLLAAASMLAASPAKPVLSVLGDSYSTFQGHIPEGNEPWYFTKANPDLTDVSNVRQTWWWQLVSEGGYILGSNESYSGSTICFSGYQGADYRPRSFITRLPRVVPSDVLLIFGATNDSWCGAPLGEFDYEAPSLGHLYEFRPALARLLQDAQNHRPGTRIVFIINSELRPEVTSSIRTVCDRLGVEYVQLHDIDKRAGHPTVAGMRQIADQVLARLRK